MNNKYLIKGKTSYGHKVLQSIITLAAKEIPGVHSLKGHKVKFILKDGVLSIDVFLCVLSSVRCPEVSYCVQENVKRTVETMTTFKVKIINIYIMNVFFEENLEEKNNLNDINGEKSVNNK